MKILMCRPDFYGVEYEINPWMNVSQIVDKEKALQQWENLYAIILNCGAQVDLISPILGWPDMVFTANAGLWIQDKILLSRFKFNERRGEIPYFETWFNEHQFSLAIPPHNLELSFEGAGDALFAGKKLFAGFGFRTSKQFYEETPIFKTITKKEKIIYCELVDPYFYHLDTCFAPLNAELAIWYPNAFSKQSQKAISAELELIPVELEEAKNFSCNAVVIDKHILLPAGSSKLSSKLEERGYSVHPCDMSEYLKAGGACKCLTMQIG